MPHQTLTDSDTWYCLAIIRSAQSGDTTRVIHRVLRMARQYPPRRLSPPEKIPSGENPPRRLSPPEIIPSCRASVLLHLRTCDARMRNFYTTVNWRLASAASHTYNANITWPVANLTHGFTSWPQSNSLANQFKSLYWRVNQAGL